MALHYAELLTKERVIEISEKYGFPADPLVEKFILCFEIHKRIAQEIHCVTRGGMCMPFHQPAFEVRRMSKDIDIFSSHSVEELERVMGGIDGSADGLRCSKITPKDPLPIEDFVSYRITYDSCLGRQGRVKVDAFCDAGLSLDTQRVPPDSRILDFGTRQEMTILSKGALMADKITSLAIGTVGVKAKSRTEIVKQIYDIATLLRQAATKDLVVAYDSYQRLTEFKVGRFKRDPPYTTPDVSASIVQSLDGFLPFDTNALVESKLLSRHNSFRGSYLPKQHPYEKSDFITDVMLVFLFAMSLKRYLVGDPPLTGTSETMYMRAVLDGLDQLGRVDVDDAGKLRREYLDKISGHLISRRMIRNSSRQHLYLIKEISSSLGHTPPE